MSVKISLILAVTAVFILAIIAGNPICVDGDSAVAAQAYSNCLNSTWASQQCRRTASEVSCRKWGYLIFSKTELGS